MLNDTSYGELGMESLNRKKRGDEREKVRKEEWVGKKSERERERESNRMKNKERERRRVG